MPTEMNARTSVTNAVTLAPEAVEVLHECEKALDQARNVWCSGVDIPWAQVEERGEEIIRERLARVAQMERSFRVCLTRLIAGPQAHDGELRIYRDGPVDAMCLFWRHERSGYHGGMIFHPDSRYPNARVGDWSLHT